MAPRLKRIGIIVVGAIVALAAILIVVARLTSHGQTGGWQLVWSDEFAGKAHNAPEAANWLDDLGHGYPCAACPNDWGTTEVEAMTGNVRNVSLDGAGRLVIRALRASDGTWTSSRIETRRDDFAAPAGGELAVEASIKLPNVTGAAAEGYWPAFWMLGSAYRGIYTNWPRIGEIDVMENVNGLNRAYGTFHCGSDPGGPCNESNGLGGATACAPAACGAAFHTYRIEIDRRSSPEQIRWSLDGREYWHVSEKQVGDRAWTDAVDHPFFIILNLAIGGAFPNAVAAHPTPTDRTVSGGAMLVDGVRVYSRSA